MDCSIISNCASRSSRTEGPLLSRPEGSSEPVLPRDPAALPSAEPGEEGQQGDVQDRQLVFGFGWGLHENW